MKGKMEKLPDYGDHMTFESFLESCRSGGFIDYDGDGYLATATEIARDHDVCPSEVLSPSFKRPAWATHVVWFNR